MKRINLGILLFFLVSSFYIESSETPLVTESNLVEMAFVAGGTLQIGSNDDAPYKQLGHKVTVSDFYIGKYEVTQKLYESVMGKNPAEFKSSGEDAPVERVSWYDAVEFCNKLSDIESLERCYSGSGRKTHCDFMANGYRLPTEAEWEYAGRGGNKSEGYKHSGSNDIGSVAWYSSNSDSKTQSVGSKQANELGIYDMSGNVWEWCNDWYGDYSSSAQTNPRGLRSGSFRVLRGGSWHVDVTSCSTATRYMFHPPALGHFDIGFRLVRAIP
jgi:formylglycine-generating enzyme required for sulfatase activity